jgi:hypothetical protein
MIGSGNSRNSSRNGNSNSGFSPLGERIQKLPFPSFQQCAFIWLGACGYTHVGSLGRFHRRGRRPFGGADFLVKTPMTGCRVAVQVRHWRTPVQRWAVDELRGFMLRFGIPSGMIVTNSKFSLRAIQTAAEYPGRPIRLVSGAELAESMEELELGTMRFLHLRIPNESFFRSLSRLQFARMIREAPARKTTAKSATVSPTGSPEETGEERPTLRILLIVLTLALLVLAVILWPAGAGGGR